MSGDITEYITIQPNCLLAEYLNGFVTLSRHRENLRQILGVDFVKENSYDPANKVSNASRALSAFTVT